jgi:Protein of unknown function (DUF1569)
LVSTRKVKDRRRLSFSTMQEIMDDVEYLDAGDPPRSTGNWTSAQIVCHVARVIECSIEGFDAPPAPLPIRLLARLFRRQVLTKPIKPGIRTPRQLQPPHDVTWEAAVDLLRQQMQKLQTRQMTQPSPILGPMTHDEWVAMHCRHAELHLSFVVQEEGTEGLRD